MSFCLNNRWSNLVAGSSLIVVVAFLVLIESTTAVGQEAADGVRANDHFRVYANLLIEKYDSNDDGYLSQAEMSEMSRPPSDKRFDLDSDGKLSFNEIVQAIQRPSAPQVEEAIQPLDPVPKLDEKYMKYADSLIENYDQNKDGYIDILERKEMRRPWPSSYDKNSDERLSKKELIAGLWPSQSSKDASKSAEAGEEKTKTGSNWNLEDMNLKFLEASLQKNDKDGNGQLDPAEIAAADWSQPDWRQSDINRDGILSRDEMKRRYEKMFAERLAEAGARQSEREQQSDAARQLMLQMMSRQRSSVHPNTLKPVDRKATAGARNAMVEIELYLLRLPEQASPASLNNVIEAMKDDETESVVERVTNVAKTLGIKQYDQSIFQATDQKSTRITSGASIPVTVHSVQTSRGRQSQVQNYDVGLVISAKPQIYPDRLAVEFEISKSDVVQQEAADDGEVAATKVVNWEFVSTVQFQNDEIAVIGSSSGNQHWILVVKATEK